MALSQSVVSELLDAFRAGAGIDLIRDAVPPALIASRSANALPAASEDLRSL
jgi:hypothetical protein